MAERVGFEPTIRFPVYTLSKRAPSATRPSLPWLQQVSAIATLGGNTPLISLLFLREKQYRENVSTNTLRWYRHALKWLPCENPDESPLKEMVVGMRERGLKPTGWNAAIRATNCYLRWAVSPHKVRKLKAPGQIMQTFFVERRAQLQTAH